MLVDSLTMALPLVSGTNKVDIFHRLAKTYEFIDSDSAVFYAGQGLALAMQEGTPYQKAISYQVLGRVYDRRGDLVIAHDYCVKGLALAANGNNRKLNAHLNNNLGIIHAKRGDYAIALGYFLSALAVWENLEAKKNVAALLGNIGTLYRKIGDHDKSIKELLKAQQLALEINNEKLVASCMHNLGETYKQKGEDKNALKTYQKALALKERMGFTIRLIPTLKGIGEVYINMGLYLKAGEYFGRALAIARKEDNKEYLQKIFFSLGKLEQARKDYFKAIHYFGQSLEITREINMKDDMLQALNALAETYTKIRDFELAFEYLSQYKNLNDSLYDEKYSELLAEMGTKFELSQKETEIEHLIISRKADQFKLWSLITIVLLIFGALSASLLFIRNRRRAHNTLVLHNAKIETQNHLLAQKQSEIETQNLLLSRQSEEITLQNSQLKQTNSDLMQFAYAASHDLREPLRTIRSYMQLLERRYKNQLDETAQEFIAFATDGAIRMDDLLQDLLAYSRIGRENARKSSVDLNRILNKVKDSLHHQIDRNKAQIVYPPLPHFEAYEAQMHLLFQNLISNAIKFRGEEDPLIRIEVSQGGGHYLISVADNGIGIDEAHRERVFTLFQRLHPRAKYEGTGMGLAICKKIVQNHKGEIWLDSNLGVGTTFYIRIPSNVAIEAN